MTASALVAAAGWLAALAALATVAALRAATARRMALVAEAAHELRGPLSAALLGLHGVVADAAGARRVAAVELELRRAGLALEDLDAAPRGRRAPGLRRAARRGRAARPRRSRPGGRWPARWRPSCCTTPPARACSSAPTGCGSPRRSATSCSTRSSTALRPVRLRAHATRTHVRIEVRDHGPGLPAPVAALAGGPHGGRRGHGLAIAARVVAGHGGRLLTAPVSSGACVVLELPRADAAPREPLGRLRRRRGAPCERAGAA